MQELSRITVSGEYIEEFLNELNDKLKETPTITLLKEEKEKLLKGCRASKSIYSR